MKIEFTHVMPIEQAEAVAKRPIQGMDIRVNEAAGLPILEQLSVGRSHINSSVLVELNDRFWHVVDGHHITERAEVVLFCVLDMFSEVTGYEL